MALSVLVSRIADPRLKEFVDCWDRARGDRPVPFWRDIDVAGLKNVLAYAWAWQYDRDTDVWTGKLAGEEIMHVLGRGFRGAKAHEYFEGRQKEVILARHRRIVTDNVGMVNSGRIFWHAGSYATGERVALPVITRGEISDTVLGVTFYKFDTPLAKPIRAETGDEAAEFFSLER